MNAFADLQWTRPLGLLLFPWIVLLWWRLRGKERPSSLATGALELWKSVAGAGNLQLTEERRHLPPQAWIWFLGLVAGSLAVVAPERNQRQGESLHVFYVDRSPSMFLPMSGAGLPGVSSETRYDGALEKTLEWLNAEGVSGAQREWQSAGAAPVRAARPPASWASAPQRPLDEVPIEFESQLGLTILTDRARPMAKGCVASGGPLVFGPVAERAGRALIWDGVRVLEQTQWKPRVLALAESVPQDARELFKIWAETRGHEWTALASDAEWVFELVEVTAPSLSAPGRESGNIVQVRGLLPAEETKDPAFWAARLAERFDAALPPRPGVISLAERQAAGEAFLKPSPGLAQPALDPGIPTYAWLALLSLLCALGAFWPRSGSPRARPHGPGLAARPGRL